MSRTCARSSTWRRRLAEHGQGTILFLDEVHRFNKAQQDALLPSVEEGVLTLIGATTENPYFEVNAPLLSRSTLFRLQPLSNDALRVLLDRGLTAEHAEADDDALAHLADRADGDARAALNALEVAVALAAARGDPPRVSLAEAEAALSARALRYERDEHYDVISAFIKSIRGSDPDAGLYWLARMLEAGEDARFIARRLVILASEDIGLADPSRSSSPTPRRGRWSSSVSPRRSSTWRRRWCTSQLHRSRTGWQSGCGEPWRTCANDQQVSCPRTCATPAIAARASSVTARATSTRTTTRAGGCRSRTARPRSRVACTTSRRTTGARSDVAERRRSTQGLADDDG